MSERILPHELAAIPERPSNIAAVEACSVLNALAPSSHLSELLFEPKRGPKTYGVEGSATPRLVLFTKKPCPFRGQGFFVKGRKTWGRRPHTP